MAGGAKPSRGSGAQRTLFESPGERHVQEFLGRVEHSVHRATERFERRWNFSVVDDKPVQGKIDWVPVNDAGDDKSGGPSTSSHTVETTLSKPTRGTAGGSSSAQMKAINKHFNLRKRHRKDAGSDESNCIRIAKGTTKHPKVVHLRSHRGKHFSARKCSSYSLRPLPPRDYNRTSV